MKKVIVIGGGPAGMIAAGTAAEGGNDVILMEKNNKLGRKLYITGKGRCNVTNDSGPEELIANTHGNPYFLYSAFYGFTSGDVKEFFEKLGVRLKVERGKRVFPVSDKSSDIVKALERYLKRNRVKVMLETKVTDIIIKDGKAAGVITQKGEYEAESVIIATGGLAYPITGSTGDGYRFAKKTGHNLNTTYPSLVPLVTEEKWCARLQGLSLKNIGIKVKIGGKTVYSDFGEMMFTHFGVTGPVILSSSRAVTQRTKERPNIYVDLKPALNEKELDKRILRDFEKYKNKEFKNSLDDLLPQKIIPVIIELSGIEPTKKVNEITKDERRKLCDTIKNLVLTVKATRGYEEAVITCGGVDTNEIDPSTMRSKKCEGLLFAGEVIDVDAMTGGFNLQIAFSTGTLAGKNV